MKTWTSKRSESRLGKEEQMERGGGSFLLRQVQASPVHRLLTSGQANFLVSAAHIRPAGYIQRFASGVKYHVKEAYMYPAKGSKTAGGSNRSNVVS